MVGSWPIFIRNVVFFLIHGAYAFDEEVMLACSFEGFRELSAFVHWVALVMKYG